MNRASNLKPTSQYIEFQVLNSSSKKDTEINYSSDREGKSLNLFSAEDPNNNKHEAVTNQIIPPQNLEEVVNNVQVEINNVAEKYSSVSEVKRFLFKDNDFKELNIHNLQIFLDKFKDHINLAKKKENFIIYFKVPIPQHAADDCHDHYNDDGYTIYKDEEKPDQIAFIIKCLSDNNIDIDIKWIKTNCDITIKLRNAPQN